MVCRIPVFAFATVSTRRYVDLLCNIIVRPLWTSFTVGTTPATAGSEAVSLGPTSHSTNPGDRGPDAEQILRHPEGRAAAPRVCKRRDARPHPGHVGRVPAGRVDPGQVARDILRRVREGLPEAAPSV